MPKSAPTKPDDLSQNPRGSVWHRWDPHIHGPGTVLNDQFGGADPWEEFLTRIEQSEPRIRALGITDYLSLDVYERAVEARRNGRLPDVSLIFPNVEMRFAVNAGKGSPVNFHLLISPETSDHVDRAKRLLLDLEFEFNNETYRCSRTDLIRLGRAFDKSAANDAQALEIGTNQFKVDPDQLLKALRNSEWAKQNVLIAVAGSSKDGTAQLQADASLAALRKKLEAAAHIVFASQEKQREFWLGRGAVPKDQLEAEWGGCKPCLHGSDAHHQEAVGNPALDRFNWINGDLTFEALRQVCIEPETRTLVGPQPPRSGMPSQVASSISVSHAPWLATPTLPLNPGLVAVIGARGSGKTALVEIIAAAGHAMSAHLNDRSFLDRASKFLGEAESTLTWADGDTTSKRLTEARHDDEGALPRVQYLSQQFVDQLCSSEGLADELVSEIERVVFQAHPPEDRMGTVEFGELREIRASRARTARDQQQTVLNDTINALQDERALKESLPVLEKRQKDAGDAIARDKKDRDALVGVGEDKHTAWFMTVSTAVEAVRSRVDLNVRKLEALRRLTDSVKNTRVNVVPTQLRQLKAANEVAGFSSEQWEQFSLVFAGDVDTLLSTAITSTEAEVLTLKGPISSEPEAAVDPSKSVSLVPEGSELSEQTLGLLMKELRRVEALIGFDRLNSARYAHLSEKIAKAEAALAKLDKTIESALAADTRIEDWLSRRSAAYEGVFQAIVDEQATLEALYAPLKANLAGESGTLSKLTFSVRRTIDIDAWAERGERLLDLRKNGPFRGAGALKIEATNMLLPSWEVGSAEDVSTAMVAFRDAHERGLREHATAASGDREALRAWGKEVSSWLYSTDHIQVCYGVQYEGVEIEQLSPGTRGIVLLLLYLAIDQDDDRPLIIDQPEENLDPKSIFEELVGRFREAKLRRQIIIVTHNANLVVNTDADQVIIAKAGTHRPGELPLITYTSGGLENPVIRKDVCDILEGGAAAFQERARRLRVSIV